MKKSIILIAAGALALTACTSSEVIEEGVQSNAIGFNNIVNKGSRAITNDAFSQFYVYGTYKKDGQSIQQVFNGTSVTKNSETSLWSYDTPRYWINDASYNFAAYSVETGLPAGANAAYAEDALETNSKFYLNINSFVADGNNQRDLVYACTEQPIVGKETNNETVSLVFKHILSRLEFEFVSGFPADYKIKVSDVRLSNTYSVGSYIGKTSSWTSSRPTTNPDIKPQFAENASMMIEAGETLTSGYVYTIPRAYDKTSEADVHILFDIDVYAGEATTPMFSITNLKGTWAPTWEAGKTYHYNISINGDAAGMEKIVFSGKVNDWVPGTPSTPDFNLSGGDLPQQN